MLLTTAAAGHEAPSLPPAKHVSVFQGPRARVNQEDVFLRCAATSSGPQRAFLLADDDYSKKRHDWKEKLCSFSPSLAPESNIQSPTIPTCPRWQCVAEQERLLHRADCWWGAPLYPGEPRWLMSRAGLPGRVEQGWTEWKNTRVAHRNQVALLPSLYDSEKYWVVLVHFIYYYFSMVAAAWLLLPNLIPSRLPESFSWCASLKLINRNMNGHNGIHLHLKFIRPPPSWCRTPLASHGCYADFFSIQTWTQTHDSETRLQLITFYFPKH